MTGATDWRVVLASASPARLQLLRQAGIEPEVMVSGVDEDAITATMSDAPVSELTTALAEAKARSVCEQLPDGPTIVIGADSLFTVNGHIRGKPRSAAEARQRWVEMAGSSGELITGHCVIRRDDGSCATRAVTTTVHLGSPDEEEIEYYIATGEPLEVAGGLTIDGLGAPFVEGVVGDPSNVVGLSLPGLRRLLRELEITWPAVVNRTLDRKPAS